MKHVICRMVFIAIGLVVGGTSVQAQDIHHGYNAPKSKTGYTVPNAQSMMGYNTTGNMDIDTMMQAHAKMAEAYTMMARGPNYDDECHAYRYHANRTATERRYDAAAKYPHDTTTK